MAEPAADTIPAPDFYIAAIGRSGSTMLSNWLSNPPGRIVFNEPFFLHPMNSRLLRTQLGNLGMAVTDQDWEKRDESEAERFSRLMGPRLRGRRWAAKEVLFEEHVAMTNSFSPPRVLITVRDIEDVALSFFDKHRQQHNLNRFSDHWVADYCVRESGGILAYLELLESRDIASLVVRYEDLIGSAGIQRTIADFTGWPGGGDIAANMADFGRGFEIGRHGPAMSGRATATTDRLLDPENRRSAARIAEGCASYQERFGYR